MKFLIVPVSLSARRLLPTTAENPQDSDRCPADFQSYEICVPASRDVSVRHIEPIQSDLKYAITSIERLIKKMSHLDLKSYPDAIVLFTADVTDLYPLIRHSHLHTVLAGAIDRHNATGAHAALSLKGR